MRRNRDLPARPVSLCEGACGDISSSSDYGLDGLTKLEDLAMRLYVKEVAQRPMHTPVSLDDLADFSIDSANAFFDILEKSNED